CRRRSTIRSAISEGRFCRALQGVSPHRHNPSAVTPWKSEFCVRPVLPEQTDLAACKNAVPSAPFPPFTPLGSRYAGVHSAIILSACLPWRLAIPCKPTERKECVPAHEPARDRSPPYRAANRLRAPDRCVAGAHCAITAAFGAKTRQRRHVSGHLFRDRLRRDSGGNARGRQSLALAADSGSNRSRLLHRGQSVDGTRLVSVPFRLLRCGHPLGPQLRISLGRGALAGIGPVDRGKGRDPLASHRLLGLLCG